MCSIITSIVQVALDKVIQHADSMQTKLDAFSIQICLIYSAPDPNELSLLFNTMIDVLQTLGEELRQDISEEDIDQEVRLVTASFESESDDALLYLDETTSQNQLSIIQTIQAYSILVGVAYFARPRLYP
jgi:chaperone required for assembly of F1-ATPase